MADVLSNIGHGTHGYYATLPGTNDALVAVPIEASGVESDDTLAGYDTLGDLLAGASTEQTTMGRKTCANVTSTVSDTTDDRAVDFDDITWTAAAGNACAKLIVCYDPDTTTGDDADLIPLYILDFSVTPAGGDVTYQVNASGVASSS